MDTPSTDSRSWNELAAEAAQATPPSDVDVRAAVRMRLSSVTARPAAADGLLTALCVLTQARWLRVSLAGLTLLGSGLCWTGLNAVREVAWFYQVQSATAPDFSNL